MVNLPARIEWSKDGKPLRIYCNVCQREVDEVHFQWETPIDKFSVPGEFGLRMVHTGEVIYALDVRCHGERWYEKHSNWYGRIE